MSTHTITLFPYTTLCRSLRARFSEIRVDLYAMDDWCDNLVYPAGVTTISQHDPASYIAAARAIEASGAQALWLQHEYGIFGGPAGEMLLKRLNRTDVPLLTTLHTVLDRPDTDQRRVL